MHTKLVSSFVPRCFIAYRSECELSHMKAMIWLIDNKMVSDIYRWVISQFNQEHGFIIRCNIYSTMSEVEPFCMSRYTSVQRSCSQMNLFINNEVVVLHPIFQTFFLYIASNQKHNKLLLCVCWIFSLIFHVIPSINACNFFGS